MLRFLQLQKRSFLAVYFVVAVYALITRAHPFQNADGAEIQPSILSKRRITQHDRTFYKFVTRPDIDAPVFQVDVHDKKAIAPGYWFVAPYGQLDQDRPGQQWAGPHIYDGKGELVWSGAPMFGYWNTFDFESRIVNGERMLTLLSNHENHGFILDNTYEIYKKVPLLRSETKVNMHEFNVFDDGKRALLLTHNDINTTKEVSQEVGFDGPCLAKYQGFREVSVDSPGAQEVIFEWDASHHIGLDEATYRKYDGSVEQQCTRGWDILHLNSIVKFPDGDYLLSARHTDAVYKISHLDGSIVWRLGGVKSDFLQVGWQFSRQHHAQVLEQNDTHTVLTLFDNGIGDSPFEHATSKRARALILLLDTIEMRADMIGEYSQPKGERTNARGSFQTLPNGNKFICWAYNSYMSEHAPGGTLVMEARIPIKLRSYRAFKHPWIGSPSTPPDVHTEAIHVDNSTMTVIHVSWNGDTRTTKWVFNEVDGAGKIRQLGSVKRKGFETRFEYKGFADRVFAEAFDDNTSLGNSEVAITAMPSPLKKAKSTVEDISEAAQEQPPLPEGAQKHGHGGSTDSSESSPFRNSFNVLVIGFSCGATITALAWACTRTCQKRGNRILRRGQEAKYMPLQQETD